MKRREVILSGAVIALASMRPAKAQQDGLFRPTQRQVAELLEDPSQLSELFLGMEALRLNLLLATDRVLDQATYASAASAFRGMQTAAIEGAYKLRDTLDRSSDEPMKELAPELQTPVQMSIELLSKNGVQPGSPLATKQATAFWTFLFVLSESGQSTTQSIRDWICGSSPFDVLCG